MPEGDALHRAARRLSPLVGEVVEVATPHPRAAAQRIAERLDGRRLLGVDARGKNLLLRFEGGYVLRSHLRMSGSWRVVPRDEEILGRPWLVLRGTRHAAVMRGGSVLELTDRAVGRLGPDILDEPPDLDRMLASLRRVDQRTAIGEALLDQRLVSGIGNMWKAECLWRASLSPWLPLGDVTDEELQAALVAASRLMRTSVETGRGERSIYRRVGQPCPRCGEAIRSRGQGDDNRTAYWCPGCQTRAERGKGSPVA